MAWYSIISFSIWLLCIYMDSGVSQIVCGVVTAGFLKKLVYPKPYDTHTEYTEVKHNEINFSGLK